MGVRSRSTHPLKEGRKMSVCFFPLTPPPNVDSLALSSSALSSARAASEKFQEDTINLGNFPTLLDTGIV